MNNKLSPRQMTLIALCTAFMAICSQLSVPIPFSTVPLTFQTFAVVFIGILLGGKLGAITLAIYLLIGAIGMPVFSGFKGGLGALVGPTGGYIVGFLPMAFLVGLGNKNNTKLSYLILSLIGLVVLYISGTVWFAITTGRTFIEALMLCVVPFVIKDIITIALAIGVAIPLRTQLKLSIQ